MRATRDVFGEFYTPDPSSPHCAACIRSTFFLQRRYSTSRRLHFNTLKVTDLTWGDTVRLQIHILFHLQRSLPSIPKIIIIRDLPAELLIDTSHFSQSEATWQNLPFSSVCQLGLFRLIHLRIVRRSNSASISKGPVTSSKGAMCILASSALSR